MSCLRPPPPPLPQVAVYTPEGECLTAYSAYKGQASKGWGDKIPCQNNCNP